MTDNVSQEQINYKKIQNSHCNTKIWRYNLTDAVFYCAFGKAYDWNADYPGMS